MSHGRGGELKTGESQLTAVERQAKALELRKQGKGFVEIAKTLGYGGPSGAHKAVMTALKKTLQEPADELRTMELERLDALHAALWPQAIAGKWLAVDRVLSVMERRAKLLGLDAPTKVAPTDPTGTKPVLIEVRAVDYRLAIAPLAPGSVDDSGASGED